MTEKPTVVFAEVKAILDQTIADWKLKTNSGADPQLDDAHSTANFLWQTADELRSAIAFGMPLIQEDVVGVHTKKGDQANLVIALKTGIEGFPHMPPGGPYRTDEEIQVIIDWIDGGCL